LSWRHCDASLVHGEDDLPHARSVDRNDHLGELFARRERLRFFNQEVFIDRANRVRVEPDRHTDDELWPALGRLNDRG
jgi:hypothetical protein